MCLVANANRDPKKTRPFRPADFDPHLRKKEPVAAKVGIDVLRQVFVERRA
jgi:hypothetical protein